MAALKTPPMIIRDRRLVADGGANTDVPLSLKKVLVRMTLMQILKLASFQLMAMAWSLGVAAQTPGATMNIDAKSAQTQPALELNARYTTTFFDRGLAVLGHKPTLQAGGY